MQADITAVIPTYNEEKNIMDCIISLKGTVKQIILMDFFSEDKTKIIAEQLGAIVIQSKTSYKERLNKGIELDIITTKWILNIDADERLTDNSSKEIKQLCNKYIHSNRINGIVLRYENIFMGKHLKYGFKPNKMRLFKKGKARLENKELDEHFILAEGKAVYCKHCLIHHDFKGIKPLILKWNDYAFRSANEIIDWKDNKVKLEFQGLAHVSRIRRYIKYSLFLKLPISMRSQLLFIYYFYFKFGFLDGEKGRLFLFLQTYWYRYLIDAYLLERKYYAQISNLM